jgi:hypothetical protein
MTGDCRTGRAECREALGRRTLPVTPVKWMPRGQQPVRFAVQHPVSINTTDLAE